MSEAALHKAVADFLTVALPREWRFSTFPSGGGGKVRGAQLKARGLKAGWPDILILGQNGRWIGIELKTTKGKLSDEQKEFGWWSDYSSYVCRSLIEVENVLIMNAIILKSRIAA